jgi:hypothetical protein
MENYYIDNRVILALEKSSKKLMDIITFIKEINFEINSDLTFDVLWTSLTKRRYIYIYIYIIARMVRIFWSYFNATKLCVEVLEKSKKLIEYYQERCRKNSYGIFLYEIKLTNNDDLNKQVTGTYVPKELILDIASWVSIEFYDKCNKIVIDYFINEFKKMDDQDLKNKIKHLKKELKGTKEELNGTKEELNGTKEKLKDTEEELEDTKEELEDTKEHALILQEMMVKDDPVTRTQVIYIATTELYAKSNNFKSGGVDETSKLKSRTILEELKMTYFTTLIFSWFQIIT